MQNLRINGERLWNSLMEMAKIGATPKGGVCRLTLTDLDRQSRDLFVRWCEEAGCRVSFDAMGNIFARREGRNPELPPVVAGSHLDSQPTGGKFDGAFGVLAALEVVRSLNDQEIETEAPIEIVSWTNEEGARFAPAMLGSGTFAGVFPLEEVYDKTDVDGQRFGSELERIGYRGEGIGDRPIGCYFEAHIEQGPILEDSGNAVGVVTGAQGQRWFEAVFTGEEAHAGPTPMEVRRDALVGAAEFIVAVNRIGHRFLPNACATCGMIQSSPNSRNTIPGRVFVTVDLRNPDDDRLLEMADAVRAAAAEAAGRHGLEVDLEQIWHFPATHFDPECVAAVRRGAERMGIGHQDMVSGAGHDAVYMASVAPTAMIFVPCENGISHNESENAKPEDLTAGCNVLYHAVLDKAAAGQPASGE